MSWTATVGGHSYRFTDLRDLLAKASPAALRRRAGRLRRGVLGRRARRRADGAGRPAAHPAFLDEAVVPYEDDEVTRLIVDTHDAAAFAPVRSLTVGGPPRLAALATPPTTATLAALAPGLTPGDGRGGLASSCATRT